MRSVRVGLLAGASIVFALSLGVILGSGPLRTALLGQDASEEARLLSLIAERDAQLAELAVRLEGEQAFLEALTPVVIEDRLAGTGVLLVATHDADPSLVELVANSVTAAGASVVATASLGPAWFAPDQVAFRSELAQQLTADVDGLPEGSGSEQVLHAALVQALVPESGTTGTDNSGPIDPAILQSRAQTLRDVLSRADLLTVSWSASAEDTADPLADDTAPDPGTFTTPVRLVVFVTGAGVAEASQQRHDAQAAARLGVRFTEAGIGAVVAAGEDPSNAVATVVLEDQSTLGAVSVVSDTDGGAGVITLVLAAQEQLAGRSGVYGVIGAGGMLASP